MKLKKFWGPLHLNLNHFLCAQKSRFFREQKSQSSMRTSCTTLPGRAASTQAHEGRNQWFQQRPRITDHGQAHEGRNWWFQQRPRIKDHGAALSKFAISNFKFYYRKMSFENFSLSTSGHYVSPPFKREGGVKGGGGALAETSHATALPQRNTTSAAPHLPGTLRKIT